MSCWIVEDKHCYYLASLMLGYELEYEWGGQTHKIDTPERAAKMAEIMMIENHNSYAARYNEFYNIEPFKPEFIRPLSVDDTSFVQMVKSIDCYSYQACEHGGWDMCQAKTACDTLRGRITEGLRLYPGHPGGEPNYPAGYDDDAEWGCCPKFMLVDKSTDNQGPAIDLEDLKDSANIAMQMLTKYVSVTQLACIQESMRGEEGEYFCELVCDLAYQFTFAPTSYEQDGMGDKSIAYFHYFRGGADWYITELDAGSYADDGTFDDTQKQAFGLADMGCPEKGYISIEELIKHGVELDFYWEPKPLANCKPNKATA